MTAPSLASLFPGVAQWRGRHVVLCNWRDQRHPDAGGAEVYCEQVARRLVAAGVRVTYLTARPRGAPRREGTDHGTVVRVGGRFGVYPLALLWLARHRRRVDAVIDSQNGVPFFAPLAVRRRTPVLLLIHHVHQRQFALLLPRPLAALGRWLESAGSRVVYGSRAVCTVSPSSRAQIRGELGLKGPIRLAPPGHTPVAPGARASRPRIVHVGRLTPQKRLHLLLRALPAVRAAVPGTELHLIGDGRCRTQLEALARQVGVHDHVVFHGRLPTPDRDALVASAWLTVYPSLREGWGIAVMEAASAGVPALVHDVPGLRDVVHHEETGWLLPEGRTDLGAAVTRALRTVADTARADRYARSCRAWASRFTWTATTGHLLAALTAERDRLSANVPERVSDSCTVVTLPHSLLRRADTSALRVTDLMDTRGPRAALLLTGVDEQGAREIVARTGVDPSDPHVRTRLARHSDLLGWERHPPAPRPPAAPGPGGPRATGVRSARPTSGR
ncbi:glycosyltransferase family 4 protein [Streptomyces flavalbus]|uniref:Glycosyltransferase family 4 protein n=1 Tax=Streptomyces flavalbus TaxID=2665155 RepID=A0ABW2WJ22_9ACTN